MEGEEGSRERTETLLDKHLDEPLNQAKLYMPLLTLVLYIYNFHAIHTIVHIKSEH